MMKSTKFYKELYMKKICSELIKRYNMEEQEIKNLLETYSFDELINENEDYFFYQSPEYWVEYLVSPL